MIYIESIEDFDRRLNEEIPLPGRMIFHLLFRGHASNSYKNLPTICRLGFDKKTILEFEKILHNEFKNTISQDGYLGSIKLHPGLEKGSFQDISKRRISYK